MSADKNGNFESVMQPDLIKQETDKKLKEWKSLELVKDKFKAHIERLEAVYDEKYRVRE